MSVYGKRNNGRGIFLKYEYLARGSGIWTIDQTRRVKLEGIPYVTLIKVYRDPISRRKDIFNCIVVSKIQSCDAIAISMRMRTECDAMRGACGAHGDGAGAGDGPAGSDSDGV